MTKPMVLNGLAGSLSKQHPTRKSPQKNILLELSTVPIPMVLMHDIKPIRWDSGVIHSTSLYKANEVIVPQWFNLLYYLLMASRKVNNN